MTMALFVAFVNENVNNGWRQFYFFIKVLRAEGLVSKQKFNVVLWGEEGVKHFVSNKLTAHRWLS